MLLTRLGIHRHMFTSYPNTVSMHFTHKMRRSQRQRRAPVLFDESGVYDKPPASKKGQKKRPVEVLETRPTEGAPPKVHQLINQ